ncbi:MAG: hypothetical protein LBD58_06085 [Treponema sp.]|jgi:hypothetical protein|nr:hypothetical protein [Treponema sp.]
MKSDALQDGGSFESVGGNFIRIQINQIQKWPLQFTGATNNCRSRQKVQLRNPSHRPMEKADRCEQI